MSVFDYTTVNILGLKVLTFHRRFPEAIPQKPIKSEKETKPESRRADFKECRKIQISTEPLSHSCHETSMDFVSISSFLSMCLFSSIYTGECTGRH